MMESFLEIICLLANPANEELEKLRKIVSEQTVLKGDRFLSAGTVPQKIAFVTNGLFRYYYANENGSEFTKGFFPENNFIVSYTAMKRQVPSYYSIEALEDSTIIAFEYRQWITLYAGDPCWSKLLIALLEKGFTRKETRERELLLLSAEERYRSFQNEYPLLEDRLKQHMIASYLGITPVALSRIRRNMKNMKD